MELRENYTYPAIIDFEEEGFVTISFPTLDGAVTSVESGEDYILAAQELLALTIRGYEDEQKELPSMEMGVKAEENQRLVYINVWMPYYRGEIKESYVKKTLTIPAWLDLLAKRNNVNFSAALVEGIKQRLGLERNKKKR